MAGETYIREDNEGIGSGLFYAVFLLWVSSLSADD
jgi:hypothetical protein